MNILPRIKFWENDGGDYTRIAWPAGMRVTVESGIDTPDVTSHFRGGWSLYFYVPRGTKLVGGWASDGRLASGIFFQETSRQSSVE